MRVSDVIRYFRAIEFPSSGSSVQARRRDGSVKMSMKLHALPPKVVSELCKHLNIQGAGVKNWKELITLVPG